MSTPVPGAAVVPVPQRVLLIQLRRIGDAVLLTPALSALREAWPASRIHLLSDEPTLGLFRDDPRVDRLWKRPPARGLPGFVRDLRAARFDLAFDFQSLPITSFLAAATGALTVGFRRRFRRYRISARLEDHRGTDYAADHKLDLLRRVGIRPVSILPELRIAPGTGSVWSGGEAKRVALVPVSSVPAKRWAPEAFADTVRLMRRETEMELILAGGPGEEDLLDELSSKLPGFPHRKTIFADLPDFARFLRDADLFIGNDNGPRHMASALGTPTVGYFNDIDPVYWTPPDPRHPVLWERAAGDVKGRRILPAEPAACARAALDLLRTERPRRVTGDFSSIRRTGD
jgi:ADP-heptose:LPS heptosyltransferase